MNISKITNSAFAANIRSNTSKLYNKLGSSIENLQNKDTFNKIVKTLEPTGPNTAFIPMAGLMVTAVIIPRIIAAAKRNPDNKEATKDERTEILFRDVQSVLVILFALKSMDSLIAAMTTKLKGVPMVNKQYKALFETNEKGLKGLKEKGLEIIKHPLKKLETLLINIKDTLHPTGGVHALNNETFISNYSGYASIDEVKKLFQDLPNHGGSQEKVFNKVLNSLIKETEDFIKKTNDDAVKTMHNGIVTNDMQNKLNSAKKLKQALTDLKNEGVENFIASKSEDLDANVVENILHFFKDKDNTLIKDAKGLNAKLRTMALGIETMYLGFGLPALNQKRLEKKYLSEKPAGINPDRDTYTPLNDRLIKPQEIKLYKNFIK